MSPSNTIEISSLVKIFRKKGDEVRAVNGVDLLIHEGELFGLLGPNGAGKTTLIKCISTLLIPDQGRATVGGFDVLKQPLDVRRQIGVMTGGERSLYWKLTPVENLNYFAALYGVPRQEARERISYLLELMDLTDKRKERVEKLSSGMKQKLSIARTLVHDPPILLIDEPTLGLDPTFSRFVRTFIKEELHSSGKKTILLTTHYMDEADMLCDRIAFMNRGAIEAVDTPSALKKRLSSEQVVEVKCLGTLEHELFSSVKEKATLALENKDGLAYVRMSSEKPEQLLSVIIDLVQNRAKVLSVNVTSPTLEDVFVHLTGVQLQEDQAEE
jgi:ABC-2 type transport system ATP-binding protein